MPLISSIFSWFMKQRIHQIELFTKFPFDVQEDLLQRLIMEARQTEFGKRYDFSSLANSAQFRNRIPLQDYESLKKDIERLQKGEQNILWPTDVRWFAKSSGTTNERSKFIPVTTEALEECHYKGGKDLLCIYFHNNPESKLFEGKLLTLGGSHHVNTFNNESFYGDLSAILIQNLPFWIQLFRTPDRSIALMDEWETKLQKMAEQTMNEDVTNIAGVPSWMLVLLKRVVELSGKNNLLEVWPNLELFVHGAVSFIPYKEQFRNLIPKNSMYYLETYNASEGFFGIQDQQHSDELLLMLDYGIYYEFIRQQDWEKENPATITLSEVKTGENYAIVITTNAGLWRYKIGDTITFTSINPFRIKITGRTAHFINAFGEELIIANAEKALEDACAITSAIIREYTAAPIYFSDKASGAHEWLIEFEKEPQDIGYFAYLLDGALKKYNSDYEAKRYQDKVLTEPVIKVLPNNTFYNWMKSKEKLGGQHKVPRLSNHRKFVEEINEMLKSYSA